MDKTWILGIDPGSAGGLALIGQSGTVLAYPMPDTRRDLQDGLSEFSHSIRFAYVEKVRSSPKMGVVSAFTFGCNYERVLMLCTCLYIPFEEVTPGTWQKGFALKKSRGLGLNPTEKKNDHKRLAQELFPKLKVTHAIADALLIAEYGRRLNNGGLR